MSERYWLVHPNGGRQLIDPERFDLEHLAEQALRVGGRLLIEPVQGTSPTHVAPAFEPPLSALGPLFRRRFETIHTCRVPYELDMNPRATARTLGGYYRKRRLVRVYTHDSRTGRRPADELFDTFLHEMAHHLEYTEPQTFHAAACGRVPGRMHSPLFWRILGELKLRWHRSQQPGVLTLGGNWGPAVDQEE